MSRFDQQFSDSDIEGKGHADSGQGFEFGGAGFISAVGVNDGKGGGHLGQAILVVVGDDNVYA